MSPEQTPYIPPDGWVKEDPGEHCGNVTYARFDARKWPLNHEGVTVSGEAGDRYVDPKYSARINYKGLVDRMEATQKSWETYDRDMEEDRAWRVANPDEPRGLPVKPERFSFRATDMRRISQVIEGIREEFVRRSAVEADIGRGYQW